MGNDEQGVHKALARAVASRKVDPDAVAEAARRIAAVSQPIRGLGVCERGIFLDFFVTEREWWKVVSEISVIEAGRLRGIEIFPWGIPWPDFFHVRVTQELDVLPELRG